MYIPAIAVASPTRWVVASLMAEMSISILVLIGISFIMSEVKHLFYMYFLFFELLSLSFAHFSLRIFLLLINSRTCMN